MDWYFNRNLQDVIFCETAVRRVSADRNILTERTVKMLRATLRSQCVRMTKAGATRKSDLWHWETGTSTTAKSVQV